eukprot:TRINITY_DN5655_c0_g1_i1.p1 TRINITY_DN5655_c0_g1~~TRINITY_DN5655_c0_g1_i1.p1  ORF type:complete len:431 (+),score=78.74 TRINITY_DN5655_c0_g1_i1:34-1293(+)
MASSSGSKHGFFSMMESNYLPTPRINYTPPSFLSASTLSPSPSLSLSSSILGTIRCPDCTYIGGRMTLCPECSERASRFPSSSSSSSSSPSSSSDRLDVSASSRTDSAEGLLRLNNNNNNNNDDDHNQHSPNTHISHKRSIVTLPSPIIPPASKAARLQVVHHPHANAPERALPPLPPPPPSSLPPPSPSPPPPPPLTYGEVALLHEYAEKHDLPGAKFFLRNMLTRWNALPPMHRLHDQSAFPVIPLHHPSSHMMPMHIPPAPLYIPSDLPVFVVSPPSDVIAGSKITLGQAKKPIRVQLPRSVVVDPSGHFRTVSVSLELGCDASGFTELDPQHLEGTEADLVPHADPAHPMLEYVFKNLKIANKKFMSKVLRVTPLYKGKKTGRFVFRVGDIVLHAQPRFEIKCPSSSNIKQKNKL